MKLVEIGSISIERELTDEKGVKYRQIEHIDLSDLQEEKEDVDPAAIKDSLGLSSNAKAHQFGLKLLKRIKGI